MSTPTLPSRSPVNAAEPIVRCQICGTTTLARPPVHPGQPWMELMAAIRDAHVRVVVVNATSARIAYEPEPCAHAVCPNSIPAMVTALLYARYVAVRGDLRRGLTFVTTELSDAERGRLMQLVAEHAQNWALPGAFAQWILAANSFPAATDAILRTPTPAGRTRGEGKADHTVVVVSAGCCCVRKIEDGASPV